MKYRKNAAAFTRRRKLGFSDLVVLIIQKTIKSLQIKLNEYSDRFAGGSISASAFVQARSKLSYRFFKEASSEYVAAFYEEEVTQKYKGYRVLAVDGTQIRLPDSEEIYEQFGRIESNNQNKSYKGQYASSLCTVLYDVLNSMVLSGKLEKFDSSEREHLVDYLNSDCEQGDLVILDRGYPSFAIIDLFLDKKVDFLIRCSSNQCSEISRFASDSNQQDNIIEIKAKKQCDKRLEDRVHKVRCVKIPLETGETEIVITSLLDMQRFPTSDFKELYFKRWRIETYFDIIKNRLHIENFTGKSVESVKQDFYSTLLLTNIESDLTREVNQELEVPAEKKYAYKVNKQVSFNAIKERAFDLLIKKKNDIDGLIVELQALFKKSTVPIRDNRTLKRKTSSAKTLAFIKYKKKFSF